MKIPLHITAQSKSELIHTVVKRLYNGYWTYPAKLRQEFVVLQGFFLPDKNNCTNK
jgi:hypothetical protein